MRRCVRILWCGVLLIAGSAVLAGQNAKSGVQPGDVLPGPFHPYNVTGAHADRPHCLVCEYALRPVAMVFARELPGADGPLTKLLQGLDAAVGKSGGELRSFAV